MSYLSLKEGCSVFTENSMIIIQDNFTGERMFIDEKCATFLMLLKISNKSEEITSNLNLLRNVENSDPSLFEDYLRLPFGKFLQRSDVPPAIKGRIEINISDVLEVKKSNAIIKDRMFINQLNLLLTKKCWRKCIYCEESAPYVEGYDLEGGNIFYEEYLLEKIIDFIKERHINEVNFTGGEPLKFKNIVDYIRRLKEENVKVSMVTKSSHNFIWLEKVISSGIDKICLSLDSSDPNMVNKLTGSHTTYGDIMKAFELCKNYGVEVTVTTVVTKLNSHAIEDIIKLCINKSARCITFVVVRPEGRCNNKLSLSIEEMDSIKNKLKEQIEVYKDKIEINFVCDYSNCADCGDCYNRYKVVYINYDGSIQPCGKRETIGYISNENIDIVWKRYLDR